MGDRARGDKAKTKAQKDFRHRTALITRSFILKNNADNSADFKNLNST